MGAVGAVAQAIDGAALLVDELAQLEGGPHGHIPTQIVIPCRDAPCGEHKASDKGMIADRASPAIGQRQARQQDKHQPPQ